MDKPKQKMKKETVSISLEPYLRKQVNEIIYRDQDFSNVSSFISTAVTEFITRYKLERDEISAMDILTKMLQTPEGKRAFDKVTSTPSAVSQPEQKTFDAQKGMEELIKRICPEPRELTAREKELAEKAKQRFKEPSTETPKTEENTPSDKKVTKIVLFENDVPREYILE